jgi:phosphoglycerol transferase MdoB-like AlkP superfamily enzyme
MSVSSLRRFLPVLALAAALIVVSLATRVALALRPEAGVLDASELALAFLLGALFDFVVAVYVTAPLVLAIALAPQWLVRTRAYVAGLVAVLAAALFGSTLLATSEWIFWDEFGSRFNFIAVDYLLYTHEVIGNIWQSYPVGRLLVALAAIALGTTLLLRRQLVRSAGAARPWRAAVAVVLVHGLLVVATLRIVDTDLRNFSRHDVANDLAGNGLYEFFAANRRNELSFERYYATLPLPEAIDTLRAQFTGVRWVDPEKGGIERHELLQAPERQMNVVLVSVESLGAEFVGAYGDSRGLTPNLDRLASESLVFDTVYATGNRTVRGLEALALALPPTPGQSIVRRPQNALLFSLGSVFEDKGYGVLFAYGGYGYFDNMNAFFDANDYRTIDRRAIPDGKIAHETVWGVADEHLFDQVIEEIDREKAANPGRPLFTHVMTTSNHRPYTYPAGRIDIPSGSGRDGAVKYTDYAIGRFMDAARKRSWFKDTVFVITADHGANARGTTSIPVAQYRIPLVVHSPGNVEARRVHRLMSQIDIAPTLLGLLDFSYYTKFLGRDVLRAPVESDRAFVGNYQTLGYLKQDKLVLLQPGRKVEVRSMPDGALLPRSAGTEALRREAISFYQVSAHVFRSGLYSDEEQVPPHLRGKTPTPTAGHTR